MRANVYVDGFNLYYGALKGTPFRWLDIVALCRLLLPGDTINRIRYFTARIQPDTRDPDKGTRQQLYLRALRTTPDLTTHYGHYLSHNVRMALTTPAPGQPRTVEVIKTEEKGSDVNIATLLLLDAFDSDCELVVVISNDSDLLLPIQTVRRRFGLKVGVLNPQKKPSVVLHRLMYPAAFAAALVFHRIRHACRRPFQGVHLTDPDRGWRSILEGPARCARRARWRRGHCQHARGRQCREPCSSSRRKSARGGSGRTGAGSSSNAPVQR